MQLERLMEHHKPWVHIDRLIEIDLRKRIITEKNITHSDFFLQGHFPDFSIFPGVLQVEGLFQSTDLLLQLSNLAAPSASFAVSALQTRYLSPLFPGQQVRYQVQLVGETSEVWMFHGSGSADGKKSIRAKWVLEKGGCR